MNTRATVLAGLFGLAFASTAVAVPTVTIGGTTVAGEGETSSESGVTILDFNVGFTLPSNVALAIAPSNLTTGNTPSQSAAPPGDTSQYLTVGPFGGSPVTITLTSGPAANYIGFYAGSLDTFNEITFNTVGGGPVTYTGSQLAGFASIPPDGNQTVGRYFNVYETDPLLQFTSVTLSSSLNAFELDNFAIGVAAPPTRVPLPGTLSLLGLSLIAAGVYKRSKAK